jgi:hypothetical protein
VRFRISENAFTRQRRTSVRLGSPHLRRRPFGHSAGVKNAGRHRITRKARR